MTEEQKTEDVARCKFCGNPGKILESHTILHEYWGYCDGCRARTTYFMTREEALKAWNREAPNAESRRLRKLEEAVRELVYKRNGKWQTTGEQPAIAAIGRLLEGEKPTIEDIGGSDPDFTGGKRTEDYVREMREAESE